MISHLHNYYIFISTYYCYIDIHIVKRHWYLVNEKAKQNLLEFKLTIRAFFNFTLTNHKSKNPIYWNTYNQILFFSIAFSIPFISCWTHIYYICILYSWFFFLNNNILWTYKEKYISSQHKQKHKMEIVVYWKKINQTKILLPTGPMNKQFFINFFRSDNSSIAYGVSQPCSGDIASSIWCHSLVR